LKATCDSDDRLKIAVVGTGIAGMSAGWLLSQVHHVTVYEQAKRPGGHSNTIGVAGPDGVTPVDMGFIVYNPANYPNLVALFRHLDVPTQPSDMSFAVSMDGGGLEYAGTDLAGLFAQRRNLVRPRFWSMLHDLRRFYREAPRDLALPANDDLSLGAYLGAHGYRPAFIQDHLLPMAAAIWSTSVGQVTDQPAAAFIRFCDNHGLLRLRDRPEWRTVTGGSRAYVARLTASYADHIRLGCGAHSIRRIGNGVWLRDTDGTETFYDHVVVATHADQALTLLADPSDSERALLGAIRYAPNEAVMHRDARLMPRRRKVWASWNYIGETGDNDDPPLVTYWMNRLQALEGAAVFVSLNPRRPPADGTIIHRETYAHPRFDLAALRAQRSLWALQGERATWYCGAYFGAGFHEDGLQAGLAVAESLGGMRRPWTVPNESGRIVRSTGALAATA
jgi:uncharacterized protein